MIERNVCLAAASLIVYSSTFTPVPDDSAALWKPVEAALGRSGQLQPGEVYKFALPRKDMKIVKDGVTVAPGLALGSWLAFKKMGNEAMVMGDLVLPRTRSKPVMLKLQQEKIEQTSIHNHLLGESPRVIYMHIEGHGDPVVLARSLAAAIALTKTPGPASRRRLRRPQSTSIPPRSKQALGYSGKVNGGILQFSVPRIEKITEGRWRSHLRWELPRRSTFSQPARERLQSPGILFCLPVR